MLKPSLAKRRAIALPIPRPDPVINATLLSLIIHSSKIMYNFFLTIIHNKILFVKLIRTLNNIYEILIKDFATFSPLHTYLQLRLGEDAWCLLCHLLLHPK